MIAAIRNRQHPESHSHRGATAAAPGGPGLIVGIQGCAEDWIKRVRSQPELGNVGFADQDRPRAFNPLRDDRIGARNEIAEQRRPERGADTIGWFEVLDCRWKTMERTALLSPRQLRVALLGLPAELVTRLQRDNRVEGRVEQLDAVEEGIHDLDARELPGFDRGA